MYSFIYSFLFVLFYLLLFFIVKFIGMTLVSKNYIGSRCTTLQRIVCCIMCLSPRVKNSQVASYKGPTGSAVEQGLQIILQDPQTHLALGHFLACWQPYGWVPLA